MNINKLSIIALSLFLPFTADAQKITLGSATTKDGGEYQGEMVMGKPNGKGKAVYKNGNLYEGEYVKGKRQGFGIFTFLMARNTRASGFRISSMVREHITSQITIVTMACGSAIISRAMV